MDERELLQECKLQLEYLNYKFGETGTTNSLLTKIEAVLHQADGGGSLKDKLFELANDFAVAKQGEVAVKLHSIHNGLK